MTIKTFTLAAAATIALASAASANGFSYIGGEIDSSTADLGQITAPAAGEVSLYSFHGGEQGALLGSTNVAAGANYDVRVNLGKRPVSDVLAVLTVDGQIVDSIEVDSRW